ncbi:PD-(D/E)XK nuclease-like domain-containing protein [Persicitalea jodogahamensis]|uniref:Putative exodeoxyribonuclease 8 PDDEXK-like domain-containing protein n=1 Tax=Persicitalea jodogahamensis TaxID=402147 RepID=A0A8J3DDJ1_9BACT|nr:PD-(D/E)XK nuclease-like domain-containing protein [Persicitalea jodogahamensis]GHB87286.1 hypothetical protein GCM10007390_48860 [Persicitalea jodogahamensis]
MDYRSLARISNSDLSEFYNFLFNIRDNFSEKALELGRVVHQHILEPHTVEGPEPGVNMAQVEKMVRAARADPFLSWVVQFSQNEGVRLWDDVATGLRLKSKLDNVYKSRLVTDLKTTSAHSREEFLRSCQRYDYDRQAAFYLDAIAAPAAHRPRFCFLAIQKQKPFSVWRFDFADDSDFIAQGRQKYRFLLDQWALRERQGLSFVPSSWAAEESPRILLSSTQIIH